MRYEGGKVCMYSGKAGSVYTLYTQRRNKGQTVGKRLKQQAVRSAVDLMVVGYPKMSLDPTQAGIDPTQTGIHIVHFDPNL